MGVQAGGEDFTDTNYAAFDGYVPDISTPKSGSAFTSQRVAADVVLYV